MTISHNHNVIKNIKANYLNES